MTDKVKKIRKEVERLKSQLLRGACSSQVAMETRCKEEAYNEVLAILDTMQEEQVSEDNNLRKASEKYLKVLSETPYNNTPITNAQTIVRELITFMDNPSKYNPNHIEELVSEDMWEASKQYALRQVLASTDAEMTEQAYLSLKLFSGFEIAVAHKDGANWQKQQMMKDAKLSGYVARDKDGSLHIFEVEPRRINEEHRWWDRDYQCTTLDKRDFSELKWDDEPVYVKLIIIKEDLL